MNTAKRSPLPTDIDVKDHALAISQILIVFRKQFLKFNLRKSQHKFWTKKKNPQQNRAFSAATVTKISSCAILRTA